MIILLLLNICFFIGICLNKESVKSQHILNQQRSRLIEQLNYLYKRKIKQQKKQKKIGLQFQNSRKQKNFQQLQINIISTNHMNSNIYQNKTFKQNSSISNLIIQQNFTINWYFKNIVTPVKNQGLTCASCWAYVATGLIQSYLLLNYNKIYNFSQEYLIECVKGSNCSGGYIGDAIQIFQNNKGIPQWTQFDKTKINTKSDKCHYISKQIIEIPELKILNNLNQQQLKRQLIQNIVGATIFIQPSFSNYSDGIIQCKNSEDPNHAVILVGWNQQGNYLFKNSYGVNWGLKGYGVLNKSLNCSIGKQVFKFKLEYIESISLMIFLILSL